MAVIVAIGIAEYFQWRRLVALETAILRSSDTPGSAGIGRGHARLLPREVTLNGVATKGDRDAPVALITYSDFECPYCRRFVVDTLPGLERAYIDTGRVLYAFKHMPIESIHRQAITRAMAAACALREGRFWSVHDVLFAAPTLRGKSAQSDALGPVTESFLRCTEEQSPLNQILAEKDEARTFGITGTPAFLLGRIRNQTVVVTDRIAGARDASLFRAVIDDLLQSKQ